MSSEPRYVRVEPRVAVNRPLRCLDCGALLYAEDQAAHTRFHSILSAQAWALAVLQTSHINAATHAKFDAYQRIKSRKFDNWSADALAEVMREMPETDPA